MPTRVRARRSFVRSVAFVAMAVVFPSQSLPAQKAAARDTTAERMSASLPKTPTVPTSHAGLFRERDARAFDALSYLRCMQGTIGAIRSGALGDVPRAWAITCIEQGNEWRAVFGTLTEQGIDVHLQYAIRGNSGERGVLTKDPVDTARVSGTARALLRGLSAPVPGAGKYEFTPVALPQDKFIEVWFVPVPSNPTMAVVGGDSLIQMSADGTRELGHGRMTPPIRTVSVPLKGTTWTLESREERIPSVSELMIARMALDLLPEVRVRTLQYESVITRARKTWTHRPR